MKDSCVKNRSYLFPYSTFLFARLISMIIKKFLNLSATFFSQNYYRKKYQFYLLEYQQGETMTLLKTFLHFIHKTTFSPHHG